jgi:hypothetical protein
MLERQASSLIFNSALIGQFQRSFENFRHALRCGLTLSLRIKLLLASQPPIPNFLDWL